MHSKSRGRTRAERRSGAEERRTTGGQQVTGKKRKNLEPHHRKHYPPSVFFLTFGRGGLFNFSRGTQRLHISNKILLSLYKENYRYEKV